MAIERVGIVESGLKGRSTVRDARREFVRGRISQIWWCGGLNGWGALELKWWNAKTLVIASESNFARDSVLSNMITLTAFLIRAYEIHLLLYYTTSPHRKRVLVRKIDTQEQL